jgi:hypothetical protein
MSAEAASVHVLRDRKCVNRQHAVAIAFSIATLTSSSAVVTPVEAAQKFQKLTGAQVHAKISGMEITDEVHWGDVFERNGTVTTYSMGHKSVGKWRVDKDQLCIDRGKYDGGCHQVWLSGKQIELRREGSTLPLEGVLQKPKERR